MNTAIRRVMEKALISMDGQLFGKTYIPDMYTEKFAEELINECCTVLKREECIEKLRQHFEVDR